MTELRAKVTLARNGRIVIPAEMRAELGVPEGGKLLARTQDGAVILEPIDTAIRRAQAMVRQYIASDDGLADELILERREASAIE